MGNKWFWLIVVLILIGHSLLMRYEDRKSLDRNPTDKEMETYLNRVIGAIKSMNGHEFEIFIAFIFREIGYKVIETPQTRDGGKDLILRCEDKDIYVELKRYSDHNLVSSPHVLKLIGSTVADGVSECVFITTSGYTKDAVDLAETSKVKIKLIDIEGLIDILKACDRRKVLKFVYSI